MIHSGRVVISQQDGRRNKAHTTPCNKGKNKSETK